MAGTGWCGDDTGTLSAGAVSPRVTESLQATFWNSKYYKTALIL